MTTRATPPGVPAAGAPSDPSEPAGPEAGGAENGGPEVGGAEDRAHAFYGRRKGKPLRDGHAALMDTALPRLALDLAAPCPADPRDLFATPVDGVMLEIGFGGAEHMIAMAEAMPRTGFIGAEPFVNGMAKALAAIDRQGLEGRIRLHHADALPLLDWLPAASLDRVYLLYADPWPKKRHWKRRFVGRDNLDRIARVLKPGGELRYASDWADYVDWTLAHLLAHPAFRWTAASAEDWRRPWAGWPGTRYEAKAIREGRRPAYLIAQRRAAA